MKKQNEKIDLAKEIRTTGIILIVIGILHMVFSDFLSSFWGLILLVVGIISLFETKRFMLLIFGIGLILVGILNLGVVGNGASSIWGLLAFFQIYWGIKEIVRYNKIGGKSKLKTNQKVLMVLGIIALSVVALFVIMFVEESLSSPKEVIGTDIFYKQVDGQTDLVTYDECRYPYATLGIRCCIPDSYLTTYCRDEAKDVSDKIVGSVENGVLSSGEKITSIEYDFSFNSPPDYLIIYDTFQGGIPSPYSFIAFGENDEEIDISIIDANEFFKEMESNYSEFSRTEGFQEGLEEGTSNAFNLMGFSDYGGNKGEITNKNGKEAIFIESTVTMDYGFAGEEERYTKRVFFLDRPLIVVFSAPVTYKGYLSEFDEMVDSIDF